MKININDEVTFSITQDGIEALEALDKRLGLPLGHAAQCWRYDKATQRCEAPLWDVMAVFGPSMYMGTNKQPIKDNALNLTPKRRTKKP